MTEQELNDAIKRCVWKKDFSGISVCRAEILPCVKVIDSGGCPTLIELFSRMKGGEQE